MSPNQIDRVRPKRDGRASRRTFRWLALVIGVLGLALAGWAIHFADDYTRATHRPVGSVPQDFPFPVEPVRFPAAVDGLSIAGWFVPCSGATRVAVLLHGAKRNRLENVARARLLRQQGYAVLLYDARGCGESEGDRLTFGYLESRDLLGALDFLRRRGFHRFGLIGFSQGGVTILNAAGSLRELGWVVLECTPADLPRTFARLMRTSYGSLAGVGCRMLSPLYFRWAGVSAQDYLPPMDNVGQLHCPLYLMAGGADVLIPENEARQLFERANEPKWLWVIPGIPHINYYPALGPVYEQHLLYFLKLADRKAELTAGH